MPKFTVTLTINDNAEMTAEYERPNISDCLRSIAAIIDEQRKDLNTDREPIEVNVAIIR